MTTGSAAPSAKDSKAKAAKKAALQGAHSHSARKVRTSVSFHRPKTLRLPREPRYPRKSIPHAPRMDQFRTIVSYVFFFFSLGAVYTNIITGH
jgi:large subunit ribosomal protein L23Ae